MGLQCDIEVKLYVTEDYCWLGKSCEGLQEDVSVEWMSETLTHEPKNKQGLGAGLPF